MPANRSRTERWRDCLHQVQQRGGSLELSLAPASGGEASSNDLIWRVRLLSVLDGELRVEPPSALGREIDLATGVELICAMCIGQNRWMFRTSSLGQVAVRDPASGRSLRSVRLSMPQTVERCSRRSAHRVSTAEVNPPKVEIWPLLSPASVVPAEMANRVRVESMHRQGAFVKDETIAGEELLPDVGPRFMGRLVNVGGGGAGLLVPRESAAGLDRARSFWIRIDLRPYLPAPIAGSVKLAHTHIDSMQNVYAGVAFDFTFNPEHKGFIAAQIDAYVAKLLERQGQRRAA